MTCKLCWIETSIYSTAGYRLRLMPHRETLKPDGACPTQNIMKRTGGGGGRRGWGSGGFQTNADVLGSFPCLELLTRGFINITKHLHVHTALAEATV